MLNSSGFKIYNASAGSGKTFTLVKQYLSLILGSKNPLFFKYLLALTFTNKAVNEMKSRILENLKAFSEINLSQIDNTMFLILCEELNIDSETLKKKSKLVLETILHNYASFDVSTIDKFNHRLIRTFAHDLKIPGNFEVELDQDSLLQQAVDNLLLKAGEDKTFTKLLVDFSIEKADDDKSWDISYDFKKFAKLLVNENDKNHIESLEGKQLNDFIKLKSYLKEQLVSTEKLIVNKAKSVLTLIEESGLQFDDFSRGSLPKHFVNLSDKKFDISFETSWQNDLETATLYPKRVTADIAQVIEAIQPQLANSFYSTKDDVFNFKFLKAIYKTLTPLSVLSAINKELNQIKEDDNKLLISEFNSIISEEIKDQPTPYIYERLGEKYKHYFIDEFQDTSQLQWQNLQPLVSNALEQEQLGSLGSLMLVGDAKQAIYRWRGGYAEQFIELYNKTKQPFSVEQETLQLSTNYRSNKTIVTFNNSFFEFLSEQVFSNETYSLLYKNAAQEKFNMSDGFVSVDFLDISKEDDKYLLYAQCVYEKVLQCTENGYSKKDIAILVRRKAEGLAVSEYLTDKGIPILSSETLLLKNSSTIRFLNNLLVYITQPEHREAKAHVLQHIFESLNIESPHVLFKQFLDYQQEAFFSNLKSLDFTIELSNLKLLSLYDLVETSIRVFVKPEIRDAYVQSYLDEVFTYSEKKGSDINGFLDYFERKENELAIPSAEALDAVKIMTIHKSKGLEFPVVVFPFAEQNIYKEIDATEWFPLDADTYQGFDKTLLNYNKEINNFGEIGEAIYNRHQSELELDSINLLYVTLTRAEQQLYIISKLDVNKKGEPNTKTYSGNLIAYFQHKQLWAENQLQYSFGNFTQKTDEPEKTLNTKTLNTLLSYPISEHNINIITKSGLLWDTHQQEAIERGNLIHDIMALIYTKTDVSFALNQYLSAGKINKEQYTILEELIESICNHPKVSSYFKEEVTVYNETDILTSEGEYIRPDRLIKTAKNEAVLIDYKTGEHNKKHEKQLFNYQKVIEKMGITITNKILIYINDDLTIKEV